MKRTCIIILSHLFLYGSYAQIQSLSTHLIPAQNHFEKKMAHSSFSKGIHEVNLDYYYAEETFHGVNYDSYIWLMNMNYKLENGDTLLNYCVVAFDSLYDPYTDIVYIKNDIAGISIDTIWMEFGHENNSGIADTLRIKVISLYGSGFPDENVVLWSTDIISTSFTDSNQINWTGLITVVPSLNLGSYKEFGVVLEYYGAGIDSAGFVAGYGNKGPCTHLNLSTSAVKSNFYPNSYTLVMKYGSFGIIPTQLQGDIYYDCDGNGEYTPGVDGENFMQDINLWCKVTITDNVGIEETQAEQVILGQNKPNPFHKSTYISYRLKTATNISMQVFDITGRIVMQINEGLKPAGKHTITLDGSSLKAGLYYYTLVADGTRFTRRMVIN